MADDLRKWSKLLNAADKDVVPTLPLSEEVYTDESGKGRVSSEDMGPLERSSAGRRGVYGITGLAGTKPTASSYAAPKPQAESRKMTPEELMKKAEEMLASNASKQEASLASGPSVTPDDEREVPEWLRGYMRNQR